MRIKLLTNYGVLFFKLMPRTDSSVWRLLYQYYEESLVIMSVEGFRSASFKINEDFKQGEILFSFLFNFYSGWCIEQLDEHGNWKSTEKCEHIGPCLLWGTYAVKEGHIQRLVECCANYAERWKLLFNLLKSLYYLLKLISSWMVNSFLKQKVLFIWAFQLERKCSWSL